MARRLHIRKWHATSARPTHSAPSAKPTATIGLRSSFPVIAWCERTEPYAATAVACGASSGCWNMKEPGGDSGLVSAHAKRVGIGDTDSWPGILRLHATSPDTQTPRARFYRPTASPAPVAATAGRDST